MENSNNINRRDFLTRTSLAVAGLTIGSYAFSSNRDEIGKIGKH